VWGGIVSGVALIFRLFAKLDRFLDEQAVNGGFDKACEEITTGGGLAASVQTGRVQSYLRILAVGIIALAAILFWSSRP
jgi:NADH-quinone oxidoreductase subunit L